MPDNLQMARQGTSFVDTESGSNATKTVTLTDATGGNFTLTYGGQTTGNIAWNAAASAVQTALAALSTIGSGNVSVTGSAGGPYTVEFVGAKARTPVTAMTYTDSTTGAGHSIAIADVTAGINGLDLAWPAAAAAYGLDGTTPTAPQREIVALPAAARSPRVVAEITAGNIEETASAVTTKPGAGYGTDRVRLSRRLYRAPSNNDTLVYSLATNRWVPQDTP